MEDTRAVAHLPGLDIEIRHRQAPDEAAEFLSVSLKATPDFDTALRWLDPARLLAAGLALNPWLAFNPWLRPLLPDLDRLPPAAPRSTDGA
jgi:hypothetical protein